MTRGAGRLAGVLLALGAVAGVPAVGWSDYIPEGYRSIRHTIVIVGTKEHPDLRFYLAPTALRGGKYS